MTHHITKDLGLLVEGMRLCGHDAVLICHESHITNSSFPVCVASKDDFVSREFWSKQNLDLAIIYTWIRDGVEIVKATKGAGIFTISKGDTDGQVGIRVHPYPVFVMLTTLQPSLLKKAKEVIKWARHYGSSYRGEDARIIQNLQNADATIVETEAAKENLHKFLAYYGLTNLQQKISVVPNPVTEDILTAKIPTSKANKIVAIGRWDDPQKDAPLLARVISRYQSKHPRTEMVVIGSGGERLFAPLVKSYAGVQHIGAIPHREIAQQLASARVCLFTSKYEGSPLAGNEALALGCTIVGPNLPFVKSISAAGPFGTVAGGRSSRQMRAALEHEMRAWENNERDAQGIANFWRERLSPTRIAGQIIALAACQNSFVDAKTDSGSLTA